MNITPMEFIVAALATFRISMLFTRESGPAKIFAKLRRAPKKKSATADWLSCLMCFSMTASAVVCFGLFIAGTRLHWAEWAGLWFALSAITIITNENLTKNAV